MHARIKRAQTHIEGEASVRARMKAHKMCPRARRGGGEVSVLLCIGVSHFFTTIYERVHECLTINKHNKAYADSLGEVCSALKPRPLIKRETVSKHTKGCFSGENNLL